MKMREGNETAAAVVGLRSMRGYSAAKDDGNSARQVKSLRRHFGQNYDRNSARNTETYGRRKRRARGRGIGVNIAGKPAAAVVGLRPMRGHSAAKDDGKSARQAKWL